MDTGVIKVADVKSEAIWPPMLFGGCHGLGGHLVKNGKKLKEIGKKLSKFHIGSFWVGSSWFGSVFQVTKSGNSNWNESPTLHPKNAKNISQKYGWTALKPIKRKTSVHICARIWNLTLVGSGFSLQGQAHARISSHSWGKCRGRGNKWKYGEDFEVHAKC